MGVGGREWPSLMVLPPPVELFISRRSQRNLFSKGIKNSCTQVGFHLQTNPETLSCHSCATSAVQIQCFTKKKKRRKENFIHSLYHHLYREQENVVPFWNKWKCSVSNLVLGWEILSRTNVLSNASYITVPRLTRYWFGPCPLHRDLPKDRGCV